MANLIKSLTCLMCFFGLLFFDKIARAAPFLILEEYSSHGSARYLGAAGATLAFPNSDASFAENPASIPLQTPIATLSFSSNQISDKRTYFISPELHSSARTLYSGGLSLNLFEFVGLGGGIETDTHKFSHPRSNFTADFLEVTNTKVPLSLALKLFDEVSLGVTYTLHSASLKRFEKIDDIASDDSLKVSYFDGSYKLSALYLVDFNLAIAATYQFSAKISAKQSQAPSLYIPPVFQVAAVYYIPSYSADAGPFSENTIGLQLDFINVAEKEVFHPTAYLWQTANITSAKLDTSDIQENTKYSKKIMLLPRVGLESLLFRHGDIWGQMWLGSYLEPALFQKSESRLHLTGGAELSFKFVMLRYALDFAKDYSNQSLGIGAALQF